MIPQTEQRRSRDPPLQRRRNNESDAHGRRPRLPSCVLTVWDMLRYGCTGAQGAHTGELPVGSLSVVVSGGAGGHEGGEEVDGEAEGEGVAEGPGRVVPLSVCIGV